MISNEAAIVWHIEASPRRFGDYLVSRNDCVSVWLWNGKHWLAPCANGSLEEVEPPDAWASLPEAPTNPRKNRRIHGRNLPDGSFTLTIRAADAQKVARALSSLLGELDGEVERIIDGQLIRIVKVGPPPAPPAEIHVPICGDLKS